ncbi:hypothetical protein P4T48_18070 [Bacillus paramycoides]|uniref:hypothetical protein n=1 Tax=Bacillus paramycoides TaxID=2026194 RepID=UPI002E1C05CA|nr:hypothetical protein [Bacillus paramycoides]
MHSKDDSSKYVYKNRFRYCSTCQRDRIFTWFTLQPRHFDELVLQPIPYGKKVKDIHFNIPAHIDEENKKAINDTGDKLIDWIFEICVCDGCKEPEVWVDGEFKFRTCISQIHETKDDSSKYLYENRYHSCSTCKGDRILTWFTLQYRHSDGLVLQLIPYGKKVKDIQFNIPAHIDEENKKAINDAGDKLIDWTFEISVCDGCKYAEVWERGKFRTCIPEYYETTEELLDKFVSEHGEDFKIEF